MSWGRCDGATGGITCGQVVRAGEKRVFELVAAKANAGGYLKPDGFVDFTNIYTSAFSEDMHAGEAKLFSLGAILSTPAVSGGVVFACSTGGAVYALE